MVFSVKLKLHQGIGANGALHQTGADDEPFEVDLLLARNFAAPTPPTSRL
jgi:hypothetical protein